MQTKPEISRFFLHVEMLQILGNPQLRHQEVALGKLHRASVFFLKSSILLKQETAMY